MTTEAEAAPAAGPAHMAPRAGPATRWWPARGPSAPVVVACLAVGAAALFGLGIRLWLLAHDPVNSDQAVVGLMARATLAGHPNTFYWGQAYGGADAQATALLGFPFGVTPWVVDALPALLSAVSALVGWRLALRLTPRKATAALAAAVAFAWPEVTVWNSTRAYGFRAVVAVCGMVLLLQAVRLVDGEERWPTWVATGLAAGVGWWASPEILTFVLPLAPVMLLGALRTVRRDRAAGARALALGSAGALLGALPWIVTNLRSGFASFAAAGADQHSGVGYLGRLRLFVTHVLPMLTGTRAQITGAWIGGRVVGVACFLGLAIVIGAGCLWAAATTPAARIPVAFCVLFPPLVAIAGPTFYWRDARYGTYLMPVAVLCAFCGWDRILALGRPKPAAPPLPHRLRRVGAVLVVLGVVAASDLAGLALWTPFATAGPRGGAPGAESALALGADPNAVGRTVARGLLRAGLTEVYANYWVAYDLDLFGGPALHVTPPDIVRDRALFDQVARARVTTWLFVGPSPRDMALCNAQFENPSPEPFAMTPASFTTLLASHHVRWHTVEVGAMEAVVPTAPITAAWVQAAT